jgi:parallel beta-helix repeat protein
MSLTKATYSLINGAPINVLDYGADPTGVTDSTATIQAAVTAASNNSSVYFPTGTYLIGAAGINVASKTGVTLFGESAVIKITAVSTLTIPSLGACSIRFNSCTRSGVRGLTINGNSTASAAVGFSAGTECFVIDCTIFASGNTGQIISSNGGVRNRFTDNLIYSGNGTARGLWLGNVTVGNMETDVDIINNTVRNHSASGIVICSVGGRCIGNHAQTNDGAGIIFPGADGLSTKNLTVTGNYCIDNLFHGMQADVIYVTEADCISGIVLSGNVCIGNSRGVGTGIYMINTRDCVITGNTCLNNVSGGIVADDNNIGLAISGNTCADTRVGGARTQAVGIRINVTNNSSANYAVTGNTLRNNSNTGLQIVCTAAAKTITNVTVCGNSIVDNAAYGIFAAETAYGDMSGVVITGNTIKGHATQDIRSFVPKIIVGLNSYETESGIATSAFTSTDTSPSVASRKDWLASNASATTITAFDDGVNGQEITIRATNGNTTIAHGGTIVNNGSVNAVLPSNGVISYTRQSGTWFETSRNF